MSHPIRILVDGYNLLHKWWELAPDYDRHTETARDALITVLSHYQDWTETPITLVFDGQRSKRDRKAEARRKTDIEIIYSSKGDSADCVIERATHLLAPYGSPLVVTDDGLQRTTIESFGGICVSCKQFIQRVEEVLDRSASEMRAVNHKSAKGYRGASFDI